MNRQPDIDRLLRAWLDHGDDTPPERYVWAALERIETTPQRGALWVSLEERIMRAQPVASIAVVVAVAVIGFAVWVGAAGGPKVGDPDVSPTPIPGAVETDEFAIPFSMVPPDGWVIAESPNSVVVQSPLGESIVIFRTEGASIWGGLEEGYMPWPNDLVAWLEDYPVVMENAGSGSLAVNFAGEADVTVGGAAAQIIDARYNFWADRGFEGSMTFISLGPASAGTDGLVFGGGGSFPVQFVVLSERGIAIFHETQSTSSLATFATFLESIRFTGG
jgi:hypothetical protein